MSNCQWHEDGESPKQTIVTVFVFGSNLGGRHGAGAALEAAKRFGAQYGFNLGWTSPNSYAVATLNCGFEKLTLEAIDWQIEMLADVVKNNEEHQFFITRIGCGLAGFKDIEIAPIFKGFELLENVSLPDTWKEFLT